MKGDEPLKLVVDRAKRTRRPAPRQPHLGRVTLGKRATGTRWRGKPAACLRCTVLVPTIQGAERRRAVLVLGPDEQPLAILDDDDGTAWECVTKGGHPTPWVKELSLSCPVVTIRRMP